MTFEQRALSIQLPASVCPKWCGGEDGRMCEKHNEILTAIRAAAVKTASFWIDALWENRERRIKSGRATSSSTSTKPRK